MDTPAEQPKQKGKFWKYLKAAALIVIGLSVSKKLRGAVGDVAKDIDPEIIEEL